MIKLHDPLGGEVVPCFFPSSKLTRCMFFTILKRQYSMMYAAPLAGVLSAVIIVTLIALDAWLEDCSCWEAGMVSEGWVSECASLQQIWTGWHCSCLPWLSVEAMRGVTEMHHILKFSKKIQIITKRYLSHHGRSYTLVSLEIGYWSWHQRINHHQPLTYRLRMCCILAPIFGLAVPRWLLRKRANWPGVKHWWQGDGGRWWLASWFWTKRCLGDGVGVGGFWS